MFVLLFCPVVNSVGTAQPTITCPTSIPGSSCTAPWSSFGGNSTVGLYFRSNTDGHYEFDICTVRVETCYRCCNGQAEVYIGNVEAIGCDKQGFSLALSDPLNVQAINNLALRTVFLLLPSDCTENIPPCESGTAEIEVKVVRSSCYNSTIVNGVTYLQACATESYCIWRYSICYEIHEAGVTKLRTTLISVSSTSNCPNADPYMIGPGLCHTICE